MQEAVSESSDSLVGFIPVRSAAGNPILYGGSTTPGTHANRYVNTSIDHMTPDGNNYVGRWLADRIFSALVQMSGIEAPTVVPVLSSVTTSSSYTQNLFIGTTQPTPETGVSVLWINTSGGNISLNLVTGD